MMDGDDETETRGLLRKLSDFGAGSTGQSFLTFFGTGDMYDHIYHRFPIEYRSMMQMDKSK